MVDYQHYFFLIDLEMIKNFCKSDITNGHHSNMSSTETLLCLGRSGMTRDSCSYKNEHMYLSVHAKCPYLVQCHKSHLHKFIIQFYPNNDYENIICFLLSFTTHFLSKQLDNFSYRFQDDILLLIVGVVDQGNKVRLSASIYNLSL